MLQVVEFCGGSALVDFQEFVQNLKKEQLIHIDTSDKERIVIIVEISEIPEMSIIDRAIFEIFRIVGIYNNPKFELTEIHKERITQYLDGFEHSEIVQEELKKYGIIL
jgi:hypothetical protein